MHNIIVRGKKIAYGPLSGVMPRDYPINKINKIRTDTDPYSILSNKILLWTTLLN